MYVKMFEDYWDEYLKDRTDVDVIITTLNSKIGKKEENNDNYYKLIDGEEASKKLDRSVDLSDDDIKKILPLFSELYKVVVGKWISYTSDWKEFNVKCIEADRSDFCKIRIWKIEDEYYLVQIGGKGNVYFICDQIEGLTLFLQKTIIKDDKPKSDRVFRK